MRESEARGLAYLTQNSAFGEHLVENRRFESCRQAGILFLGHFERIGSRRLWQNHRFRDAARLESLSRVSLRESEAHGFAYLTQNSTFGRHLVENRRFESCRQAGILISGLFERIGSARLWQNHRFRAAARLESLSRVSLRESETHGFACLTQNSTFGRHLVENRRFESCRQAGILISGLFERIGSTRLCIFNTK